MTDDDLKRLKQDIEELSFASSVKAGKPLLQKIQSKITTLRSSIEDAYASNLLSEISAAIVSVPGNQRNRENMLAYVNSKLYLLESHTK